MEVHKIKITKIWSSKSMADGELWEFEVARSNRVYSTIRLSSFYL